MPVITVHWKSSRGIWSLAGHRGETRQSNSTGNGIGHQRQIRSKAKSIRYHVTKVFLLDRDDERHSVSFSPFGGLHMVDNGGNIWGDITSVLLPPWRSSNVRVMCEGQLTFDVQLESPSRFWYYVATRRRRHRIHGRNIASATKQGLILQLMHLWPTVSLCPRAYENRLRMPLSGYTCVSTRTAYLNRPGSPWSISRFAIE